MKRVIYADNAATTKLDEAVFDAMKPFLLEEYGNPSQPYSLSRAPKQALRDARETIAACIGALPEEVFFTSGGTESDNWVIKGSAFGDDRKRATITTSIEHHAILHACSAIERLGYPVAYLSPDAQGIVSGDILQQIITNETRLTSVMFSNNEIGTIQPIKELCTIAHEHGSLFHTDAVQAVGHVPINVNALGVDFLSASAHKFNGPKGIGFLYIRKGTSITSFNDGGAQEHGYRAGTENVAGIVGMAQALKDNCAQMDTFHRKMSELEKALICTLDESGLDYIRNGAKNHVPGNISLSFKDSDGEMLLHRLDLMGIAISTGSACDSENTQISHVIQAIKVPKEYAQGTVRVSFGKYNTKEDAKVIGHAFAKVLK